MILKNAKVFTEDFRFEPRDIYVNGDHFTDVAEGEVCDAGGLLAIPGLIDLHLHGCMGHDFCDGTEQAFDAILRYQAQNGVTAVTPASMTLPEQTLTEIFTQAATYRDKEDGAAFLGINMEGPFFSAKKKGAQNGSYLHEPDPAYFERLWKAANGRIKTACVAPELAGAMAFIEQAKACCPVAVAHTEADYDTAMAAFAAGASRAIHLYNAMPPFSHRAPGVIGAVADSGAMAELICDGVHIHPAVVRATLRMLGEEKLILISDSMMATGLQDGPYSLGGQAVTVRGNLATLEDGTIAGSATNLFDCLRRAVSFGVPLETAVRMATDNPARAIGEQSRIGSITPGKLANLVLIDPQLAIHAVYLRGRKI